MAARKVLEVTFYDSNYIGAIDMVTGHLSISETRSIQALDDYDETPNGNYVEFDGYGGRLAKYLGDGLFAPEGEDFRPAQVNNSAGYIQSHEQRQLAPLRIGKNTSVVFTDPSDAWQGYTITLGDGTPVQVYPSAYFSESANFTVSVPGYTNDVSLSSYSGSIGNEGYVSESFYFVDGAPFQLRVASGYHPEGNMVHVFRIEFGAFNPATGQHSAGTATAIASFPEGAVFPQASNGMWVNDAGQTLLYGSDYTTMFLYDHTAGTFVVHEKTWTQVFGDSYSPNFLRNREKMYLPGGYLDNEAFYTQCRTVGFKYMTVDRNFVIEERTTAPLSFLPDATSPSWYVDDDWENSHDGSCRVYSINYFTDAEGVKQKSDVGFAVDMEAHTVVQVRFPVDQLESPLQEIDFDAGVVSYRQAYEVQGTVTTGATNYETDVILIDNESRCVCGRTRSVNGAYYFRCWTPGSKTVLAKHPDGKYRMGVATPKEVG